ncbi:hypothetical protein A2803_04085 [Candidatus Woesebacteria bacterium RIFCSPHIGHO2_01_FULL_44_21]|uniref:Uncharacterized protein n=1 Tax=Candidatus Woesebacteria bacterium RIFCSPHIGHO2_01_FULL_44_21 TaxID=1802503 RepID=A0A1F7YZK0_9BACT|nr:MAG: hypothetical protein A2803_04085 [Candidatus Woesebacteria bacterium RIFCSPHIGHO2_01_FULL_44_21]OGM69470.1 MAG: hypothetical protein A2897_03905 [Candidatus Woesebacteria bacterium RIFCSPLOWO2_01_FULL_44_24b]
MDEPIKATDEKIEDAEVVGENVMSLLEIQDAINSRLKKLENLKEDMKPHKEMLGSIFANDEDYTDKNEIAKKASKNKSEAKHRILRQPQAAELNQKIEDIKNEGKELQESLSYYLREYQRLTGANEFESEDGELRQIVYIAKLVRKTNLNE